ncbi:thymidylate kinase isoform X1 [Hippocampus comes]|uniref:thymidylate kinase isoform X1 n=1 Tax=Hippocampus comes TaxID=109280 RepID=UPI00094EB7B5|nr:PREDICTED: thymidylate kinase isoform X1 [Hippocampus comes]
MAAKRGALIVLEGVDKAGKTTQCKMLVQALQQSGYPAEMMRFPDRSTTIGKLISAYLEKKSELEDHTVHLLFSANRWEMVPEMKRKLEQGTTLVVDRYAFSGAAFTSAKPGFSLDWCTRSDVGLPKPDVVLFLQLSPAEAASRGRYGEERYEDAAFQSAVLDRFRQLMDDSSVNWKVRIPKTVLGAQSSSSLMSRPRPVQVVDASGSVDDVHKDIALKSLDAIHAAQTQPLGELWK